MSELYDFQTKKSVHIKLSKDTHSKFRIGQLIDILDLHQDEKYYNKWLPAKIVDLDGAKNCDTGAIKVHFLKFSTTR